MEECCLWKIACRTGVIFLLDILNELFCRLIENVHVRICHFGVFFREEKAKYFVDREKEMLIYR